MTLTDFTLAPVLPWSWIVVLAALVLLPAGIALARRAAGGGLRLALGLLLIGALLDPRLLRETRRPEPDVAVLVIDETASQQVGARGERTARAAAALRERLAKWPSLELRETVVRDAPDGEGGSRLFEALGRALTDVPPTRFAGAILITDGQVHDVPAGVGALPLKGPVHGLISGERNEIDRRLIVDSAPAYGVVGTTAALVVRIEDAPAQPGARATVTVTADHAPPMTMHVPVGRPVRIELPIERPGPMVVELAVEPLAGEITTRNNQAALTVNGVRDRLRVLLLSGQPHPGERAWRNLLKADPAVDLVHFTILRTAASDSDVPNDEMSLIEFPVRELFLEKLPTFDLVVFDRFTDPDILPRAYLDRVADYVRRGGALLLALGPEVRDATGSALAPLRSVLPAHPTGALREAPFRPKPTAIGERHPVAAGLGTAGLGAGGEGPWGRWFRQLALTEGEGRAVMAGLDGAPLLVLGRFGEGRSGLLASDQIWLWARGFEGGGPYAELIRRLAHWLMKEPDLDEEDLRARAHGLNLTVTRQSLSAELPPVTLTDPDGQSRTLTLAPSEGGRATASVAVEKPGVYRVDDGTRQARVAVGGLDRLEFGDMRATEARLAPLVAASGGGLAWLAEGNLPDIRRTAPGRPAGGRDWLGLVEHQAYTVTGARETPLLPVLAVLILMLGALAGAWWREGRGEPI